MKYNKLDPTVPPPDPSSPSLPFDDSKDPRNCYWVGNVLASEYPGANHPEAAKRRLAKVLAVGIRDFIDLTHPNELEPYEPLLAEAADQAGLSAEQKALIRYQRFTIQDGGIPSRETFERILSAIQESQDAGRRAIVHCWGGIGRTGVIMGSWLVRSGQVDDGDAALQVLEEKWKGVYKNWRSPTTPETPVQFEFLRTQFPKKVPA